jgi:hypothetical protein
MFDGRGFVTLQAVKTDEVAFPRKIKNAIASFPDQRETPFSCNKTLLFCESLLSCTSHIYGIDAINFVESSG